MIQTLFGLFSRLTSFCSSLMDQEAEKTRPEYSLYATLTTIALYADCVFERTSIFGTLNLPKQTHVIRPVSTCPQNRIRCPIPSPSLPPALPCVPELILVEQQVDELADLADSPWVRVCGVHEKNHRVDPRKEWKGGNSNG